MAGTPATTQAPASSRAPARGRRWVVATAHPLGTRAAAEVLHAGGRAAAAAVAANAVLAVVLPHACGPGGDLYHEARRVRGAGHDGAWPRRRGGAVPLPPLGGLIEQPADRDVRVLGITQVPIAVRRGRVCRGELPGEPAGAARVPPFRPSRDSRARAERGGADPRAEGIALGC